MGPNACGVGKNCRNDGTNERLLVNWTTRLGRREVRPAPMREWDYWALGGAGAGLCARGTPTAK
jgi:hypothetical protein